MDTSINKQTKQKEIVSYMHGKPMTKNEVDELYSYESAICKIKYETLINSKIVECFCTGFFCEINDINFPFRKALFTNNHVLDENKIKIYKQIEFESCGKKKKLKLQKIERYLGIINFIIHVQKFLIQIKLINFLIQTKKFLLIKIR